MTSDLLDLTAELIDIPSLSHHEQAITDHIEAKLRATPWLTVDRHEHNLIARTNLGRSMRVVLAGHTDTVPVNNNDRARLDGDTLWGLGASDMKSGVAVQLELATTVEAPAVDVTYVFYACEEVVGEHNGLGHVARDRPELLRGDVAILGEPTDAVLEAGCQGTMRLAITLMGVRAHSARPWMGRNAIHRLGKLLAIVDGWEGRRPVVDGCEYREAVQAVQVEGGVAGNVVPDRARVMINHRFAPDRTPDEADAWLRELLAPALDDGDSIEIADSVGGARPGLDHPLFAAMIARNALDVRAKLGWTDVARFSALGMPAVNLGPGDPLLAHAPDERVTRAQLDRTWSILHDLLVNGA